MIWGDNKNNIKILNIGIPKRQEYNIYVISYGNDLIIIPITEYIIKHNYADGFSFLSLRRRYYLDEYSDIQHVDGFYDDISDYILDNNEDIIDIAKEFGIYDEDDIISVYLVDKYKNQLTKFSITEVNSI